MGAPCSIEASTCSPETGAHPPSRKVRIAFATCSQLPHGWTDDHPAARLLGADYHCWDDTAVDWERYERVVIRSTWDYTWRAEEFVRWARRVGPARLRNPPELVAFNVDKRYLSELAASCVPTSFVAPGDPLPALSGEVVVKPNLSAGARATGRFGPDAHDRALALIERIHESGRVALVQRYVRSVDERGESALVFLGGELSHALRKRAVLAPDEVAPTVEDGLGVARAMLAPDLIRAHEPSARERRFAEAVIAEVGARLGTPPYARVDLVSGERGEPLLLELEAVEPNLYLAHGEGAAERLARAVLAS